MSDLSDLSEVSRLDAQGATSAVPAQISATFSVAVARLQKGWSIAELQRPRFLRGANFTHQLVGQPNDEVLLLSEGVMKALRFRGLAAAGN